MTGPRRFTKRGNATSDFIGPYRVIKHLSVTASVQMHLAREDGRGGVPRDVVLKMMPKVSGEGATDIEELTQEVTACAKLTHPCVVRIRHFFEHDDALVLVVEHVDGIPLAAFLADQVALGKRPFSDDAAFHIGVSLCDALAHAHALDEEAGARAPIIHRAVSPSNVLVARDGAVKLDGFGFAKILGGVATESTGSFKWTPAYMAPEQVTEQPATPKIDVYAAGLILWELFAGRPPVISPNDPYAIDETLKAVATRNPPPLARVRPDLPRGLSLAVDAALVSAPAKRTIACADIAKWLRKAGRLDAGKRELRELVIRAQAVASRATPSMGPPSLSARPPDGAASISGAAANDPQTLRPPPVLTFPASGVPALPRVSETPGSPPSVSEPVAEPANVWMKFLQRLSLVNRLQVRTPWRRYPLLVAWVALALGLAGLLAKIAFSGRGGSVNAGPELKADSVQPTETPPENELVAAPSASPASSSELPPADEFSEELKARGLGYLTVHSSAPHANVYVNLKARGKIEEKLTVPCGNKFVSIGLPAAGHGEPLWLAPGKTMLIPCGGPLETTMDPHALRSH